MAERRKAESLGDKFQYPDIFEINNIKVKWEDRKFSDPDLVVSPPSLKKMKKSEPEVSNYFVLERIKFVFSLPSRIHIFAI
jgi:hypothetical protein